MNEREAEIERLADELLDNSQPLIPFNLTVDLLGGDCHNLREDLKPSYRELVESVWAQGVGAGHASRDAEVAALEVDANEATAMIGELVAREQPLHKKIAALKNEVAALKEEMEKSIRAGRRAERDRLRPKIQHLEQERSEVAIFLCERFGDESLPETGDTSEAVRWAVEKARDEGRREMIDDTYVELSAMGYPLLAERLTDRLREGGDDG